MRNKMRFWGIITLVAAIGFSFSACSGGSGGGGSGTEVIFIHVTANGSTWQTTTQLTLTFSQPIPGLSAADITLSGVSGVSKGTLSGSGPTYTLSISGFTADGILSVMVAKSSYTISDSPKTVMIYYYNSGNPVVTLNSVTADGSTWQTTTQLTLTFSQPIPGLSAADITLSGVSGVTRGTLSGSGPTYTLPINGVTADGILSVMVAKSGYNINGLPQTVAVYYYSSNDPVVTLNSVTADGSHLETTTQLTLTFSQVIDGLSAGNIILSGVSDVTKGTLSNSESTYTLPISGFTAGGILNVMIAKSGYTINGLPQTVTIYYYDSSNPVVTLESVTANGSVLQTTTQLTLTFSQAIDGLSENDIILSGVPNVSKGMLSNSESTYTLPISGFTTGGILSVMIEKSGYTINDSPKTVIIYFYYEVSAGIVINLTGTDEWELIEKTVHASPYVDTIFTADESYVTYRWYLDGISVGTASSYIFNEPVGAYQLVLVVTDSTGEKRSGRCWVKVAK